MDRGMMKRGIRYFIILSVVLINVRKTQEIPNEFYIFKKNKFSGTYESWDNISTLGPPRFNIIPDYYSAYDSIKIVTRFGLINKTFAKLTSCSSSLSS